MKLEDFVKLHDLGELQPYQRRLIEAIERGETIRATNWNEGRTAQRAYLRHALDAFRRLFYC